MKILENKMKIGKHTFGNETFYYVKREEEWGCEYWQSGFWDFMVLFFVLFLIS